MSSIAFGFSRFKLGRRFYHIYNQCSKAYPPGLPHVLRDPTHHYKRLIVCCDGTWKSFYRKASDPTNVTRFSRAIDTAHLDQDGKEIQQVLLYQPGVGTGAMNWIQRRFAASLGFGLNENVTEAYMFLANNFEMGDEIFLFGYSRGAYTARAVAGLVSAIGLLKKGSLHHFHTLYEAFQNRKDDPVEFETLLSQLESRHHWAPLTEVKIKVVGCWDTVGSLGLPETRLGELFRRNNRHKFHDTQLSPIIENAFHCLALEEDRRSFRPSLWHLPQYKGQDAPPEAMNDDAMPNARKEVVPPPTLRQIWMVGVHADVGGSSRLAKIALAWMMDQCNGLLTFDKNYTAKMLTSKSPPALLKHVPWSPKSATADFLARLEREIGGLITRLPGSSSRTPGQYSAKGLEAARICGDTNELIHPSVQDMLQQRPEWRPKALEGFERVAVEDDSGQFKWVKTVSRGFSDKKIELLELRVKGEWEEVASRHQRVEDD